MRVAILDDIHRAYEGTTGVSRLRERAEVQIFNGPFGDPAALRGFDAVVANRERTRFTRDLLQQLPNLKIIAQTGNHAYHIDLTAAEERKIIVAKASGGFCRSAAELAFGLMIAVMRRISSVDREVKLGRWPMPLTFLGLAGLEDPPRRDVPDAIRACQRAGIRVIMITGDHAVTARSIARAVGLGAQSRVVRGRDLAHLAEASPERLLHTDTFARVSPDEKLQLVRDASALRQADIGVAMGLRGTDVARETAAMILLNDAFPTIVAAIREGRVIFGNIRRFVAYLLSCNLCEVFTVGVAVLFGLPLPLLRLQILFLNLVTDVFPAFAAPERMVGAAR